MRYCLRPFDDETWFRSGGGSIFTKTVKTYQLLLIFTL